jgi:hypothetical protein
MHGKSACNAEWIKMEMLHGQSVCMYMPHGPAWICSIDMYVVKTFGIDLHGKAASF